MKQALFLVDEDEREIPGTRRTIRATQTAKAIAGMADELRAMMGPGTFLRERLPDGTMKRLT